MAVLETAEIRRAVNGVFDSKAQCNWSPNGPEGWVPKRVARQ
jgi:hypothetical protein